MLASADGVRVVADSFRKHNVQTSVVDPVREFDTPQRSNNSNDPSIGYGVH